MLVHKATTDRNIAGYIMETARPACSRASGVGSSVRSRTHWPSPVTISPARSGNTVDRPGRPRWRTWNRSLAGGAHTVCRFDTIDESLRRDRWTDRILQIERNDGRAQPLSRGSRPYSRDARGGDRGQYEPSTSRVIPRYLSLVRSVSVSFPLSVRLPFHGLFLQPGSHRSGPRSGVRPRPPYS